MMRCLHFLHCAATVFLLASWTQVEMTAAPVPIPAKEWSVVPPICDERDHVSAGTVWAQLSWHQIAPG